MKIFKDLNEAIKAAQEVGTMECPAILVSQYGDREHYLTDREHYQQELAQIKMDWIGFTHVRMYVGNGRPYDNWTWENDYIGDENGSLYLPDISSEIIEALDSNFDKRGRPDPDLIRRQMKMEGWNAEMVRRLSDSQILKASRIKDWDAYERYMNFILH